MDGRGAVVVVTGATGNVGTALVAALDHDERVAEVRAVARRPPADDRRATVRWFGADVAEDDLAPAVEGADAVVHLAWRIQPSWDLDGMRRTNVDGSAAVFAAAAEARVPALVHASSLGAYTAGPKDAPVDETWPIGGHAGHPYSEHKAAVEGLLDQVEREHPSLRVVRLRPALIMTAGAGRELRRYFLPRVAPLPLLVPALVHRAPTRFQVVHTSDVADAFVAAALGSARGAFNVATDDPIGAGPVAHVEGPARLAAAATWRLHAQPVDPGWVTLLFRSPLIDASRARAELGWRPRWSGADALADGLAGIRRTRTAPTAALRGD